MTNNIPCITNELFFLAADTGFQIVFDGSARREVICGTIKFAGTTTLKVMDSIQNGGFAGSVFPGNDIDVREADFLVIKEMPVNQSQFLDLLHRKPLL